MASCCLARLQQVRNATSLVQTRMAESALRIFLLRYPSFIARHAYRMHLSVMIVVLTVSSSRLTILALPLIHAVSPCIS